MAFSRTNGDLLKHTMYTPVQKVLLKVGKIFVGVKVTPGFFFKHNDPLQYKSMHLASNARSPCHARGFLILQRMSKLHETL